MSPEPKLTQIDILTEAVETERENIASLKRHTFELAKKKKKNLKKKTYSGPVIRIRSTTETAADGSKCARNFVTFSGCDDYKSTYFPGIVPRIPAVQAIENQAKQKKKTLIKEQFFVNLLFLSSACGRKNLQFVTSNLHEMSCLDVAPNV